MAKHTIVLIPGDGIGPEVSGAAKKVIEAAGLSVDWVELPAGATALDQGLENVLPERTLAATNKPSDAPARPVGTPVGRGIIGEGKGVEQRGKRYVDIGPAPSRLG